jgi:dTDP-glucose 4,6-dehydratase
MKLIEKLSHRSILVTGATGLIGSQLIHLLAYANKEKGSNIRIIGHARNKEKIAKLSRILPKKELIDFIIGDIGKEPIPSDLHVDYIVHTAAPTASRDFVETPVEVISTIIHGMEHVLQFAENKLIQKVVYLSTMEVYGVSQDDRKRTEQDYDQLDHLAVRSSYPESKKMTETMGIAWFHQKKIPVCIARLTQTFGAGVSFHDQRVFAQFARCVVEKQDIVLHTAGDTRRNYLHIKDALTSILTLLVYGVPGETYNVANDEVYLSIREMAELVASYFGNNSILVKYDTASDMKLLGYAPPLQMNLSTEKLRALGWEPKYGIIEMFDSMIQYWDETRTDKS